MAQLVLLAAAAPARLVPSDLGGLAARRGTRRTWGRGPAVAAGRRLAGTRRPGLAGSGLRRRRSPGGTLARSPARAHRGATLRGGRPASAGTVATALDVPRADGGGRAGLCGLDRRDVDALVGEELGREGHGSRDRVVGGLVDGPTEVELGRRFAHDLDVEDEAQVVVVDRVHQLAEHLEALPLPRDEGVLLAHRAQVDPLAQVVHLGQMLPPAHVDDAVHDLALQGPRLLGTARQRLGVLLVVVERLGDDALGDLRGARALEEVVGRELRRVVLRHRLQEQVEVPLLGVVARARGLHERLDGRGQQLAGRLLEVVAVHDLQAPRVDDLALLVHYLVVLEDVLSDLRVPRLDGG